MLQPLLIKCHL